MLGLLRIYNTLFQRLKRREIIGTLLGSLSSDLPVPLQVSFNSLNMTIAKPIAQLGRGTYEVGYDSWALHRLV